jgi:hypothetical protein
VFDVHCYFSSLLRDMSCSESWRPLGSVIFRAEFRRKLTVLVK